MSLFLWLILKKKKNAFLFLSEEVVDIYYEAILFVNV